jgi:catechol 2,3-dioxygenase-like lactoylglutathione lyase family enzyme
MAAIARLSHVGFNVPRAIFDRECEFWEQVIGLKLTHAVEGRNAFFSADPLRDHEFILFAVDGEVSTHTDGNCMLNHVAFDVATAAEVDELTARLRTHGFEVEDHDRGRRRSDIVSPAGIRFEINTPPYLNPRGRDRAEVTAEQPVAAATN